MSPALCFSAMHEIQFLVTNKGTDNASAHESWSSLGKIADLVKPAATNRTEFIQECKEGKFDGVVAAYRTFNSVAITGLVDEELVAALPKSLTYLAHCGRFPCKQCFQASM